MTAFIMLWYKRHCSRSILKAKKDSMVTCSSSENKNIDCIYWAKTHILEHMDWAPCSESNFRKQKNILLTDRKKHP
jgi:hypothetical protein